MMAPAITGNLRAVAVDPTDEKSIYVATQEGTLARSSDGGVTWTETVLSPFLFQSPTIGPELAGEEYSAVDVFGGFKIVTGNEYESYDPVGRRSAFKMPSTAPPSLPAGFPWIFPFRMPVFTPEPLLEAVTRDPRPFDDIQYIAICPGGANTVLVSTSTKLLGAADGTNFVELFSGRESAPIQRVACSPTDPNEVIVTSGDGTFRSVDGGFSFVPIGQVAGSAMAFGPPGEDGAALLFLVAGRELWVGSSNDADAMQAYPVGGEGQIRNVVATPTSVWLVTDEAVLVTRDAGETWETIPDLEGFPWQELAVANGPDGREHVLVLRDDIAYLSTDGGVTFRPSFRGESRRTLRRIAALPSTAGGPSAFLLLTSGELWTSAARDRTEDPKLAEFRRVAARRLKQMPPLRALLDRAVFKARLSDLQVDALARRSALRGWFPGVELSVRVGTVNVVRRETATVSAPTTRNILEPERSFMGLVEFVWELPDAVSPANPFNPTRAHLFEIRKRLEYFIEDAYLERRQVLSQLAGGGLNGEQALTLQARLEVLDVVLEEFTSDKGPR